DETCVLRIRVAEECNCAACAVAAWLPARERDTRWRRASPGGRLPTSAGLARPDPERQRGGSPARGGLASGRHPNGSRGTTRTPPPARSRTLADPTFPAAAHAV